MGEILHMFWLEFKHFQKKMGPLYNPRSSHIWHEFHLLAYTEVLGFVAFRTTSKNLVIGACEKIWGDVNHIKTCKRSHMGVEYTKESAVLYTTTNIHEASIRSNIMEKLCSRAKFYVWR